MFCLNRQYSLYVQATWLHGYWVSDMRMECFTGTHLHWAGIIGVPLLLLFGLGIPLVSLAVLLYHRHALDQSAISLRYAFIYRPYRCVSAHAKLFIRVPCLCLSLTFVCESSLGHALDQSAICLHYDFIYRPHRYLICVAQLMQAVHWSVRLYLTALTLQCRAMNQSAIPLPN